MAKPLVFYGTLIHCLGASALEILEDAFIAVDASGTIVAVGHHLSLEEVAETLSTLGLSTCPVRRLSPGQFLMPGFVDAHSHAPQWTQRGLGQGMRSLDWLGSVAFPNEARFRDIPHTNYAYRSLVKGMLRQGVTAASYTGSLHAEATKILATTCFRMGQRALVGKCNMDRNAPDYYRDECADISLVETASCVQFIKSINPEGDLVRAVLTPRSALSCTPELLAGLGAMANADPSLALQTHFAEAYQEASATLGLFTGFSSEADLYNHFGLLTSRTILAHCTLVTPQDLQLMQQRRCGIAHCPTANMTASGVFMAAPIRQFLRCDLHVGLGTNCGGGHPSTMLDSMRHALIASSARAMVARDADSVLTLDEVFYMATLGGASVLGWGNTIGNFQVGKQFDALLIDLREQKKGINAPIEQGDSSRAILEKYIMTGDDRNVSQVFVKGHIIQNHDA